MRQHVGGPPEDRDAENMRRPPRAAAIVEYAEDIDVAARKRDADEPLGGGRGADDHQIGRQQALTAQPMDVGEPGGVRGGKDRRRDKAPVDDLQDARGPLRRRQQVRRGQEDQTRTADGPDDLVEVAVHAFAGPKVIGLEAHQGGGGQDRAGRQQNEGEIGLALGPADASRMARRARSLSCTRRVRVSPPSRERRAGKPGRPHGAAAARRRGDSLGRVIGHGNSSASCPRPDHATAGLSNRLT